MTFRMGGGAPGQMCDQQRAELHKAIWDNAGKLRAKADAIVTEPEADFSEGNDAR